MPADRKWVQEKLGEIEHKRGILRTLLECLEKWEEDVDWEGLPPSKQAALLALAKQSTDTLQHLIDKLSMDIRAEMQKLSENAGLAPNGAGQQ